MFYKNYLKYTIPSVVSFALTGVFVIVDGFFVGNSVGDVGVAATNIAWPVAAISYALGEGTGMGGSVIYSTKRGENKPEEADRALGTAIILTLILGILVTILMFSGSGLFTGILGASGETHELSALYLRTLSCGAVAQIAYCSLLPIVRSMGYPMLAMASVVAGCIVNIVLDWLFVMVAGWGVFGAALATILGEYLTAVPLVICFFSKKNRISAESFRISKSLARRITAIGISPFGLMILPSIWIIIMNLQAEHLGGDAAVAAFAIMGYLFSAIQLSVQGFSEGAQPLLSYNTGAGNQELVRKTIKLTYGINIGLGLAGAALGLVFCSQIAHMFGISREAGEIFENAMRVVAYVLPVFGFTRTTADYLYATGRSGAASVMVFSEGALLMPGLILILPFIMGLSGIWTGQLCAELIVMLMGLWLLMKKKDRK